MRSVLNIGFTFGALVGVLGTNQVLLNVVISLWLVQETDAPRVLLAWLFGTDTVMAVSSRWLPRAGATRCRARCGRPGSAPASSCSRARSCWVWAPAAFTFLAMEWGILGWLVIAGGIVVRSSA